MIALASKFIIGFSVVSAAILLIAYVFFLKDMKKSRVGILACASLLVGLAGLQLSHWYFLDTGYDLFASRIYVVLLLLTPPSFYFFSREILMPASKLSAFDLIHVMPLLFAIVTPAWFIVPVAMAIGAAYSVWFVRVVYGIRNHVRRFKFEMFFFALFAILAIMVLILALSSPFIDNSIFYLSYANFTGAAFILIVSALIGFPELLTEISVAAEIAYAKSTLNDVDIEQKLKQLDRLMNEDKIFQNENLNLSMLAECMELSGHQLSELINTSFGHGFSRYVREHRVAEAKRLLREDSRSSVLSIGLTTGFKSQSNFYTAFHEVTGQSPGNFRKNL